MTQSDLFAQEPNGFDSTNEVRPRARAKDPETSHAAAVSAEEFVASHRGIVYAGLTKIVEGTTYDIAAACGLEHPAVHKRTKELELIGMIERTGRTKLSPSKRACTVWKIVARPPSNNA